MPSDSNSADDLSPSERSFFQALQKEAGQPIDIAGLLALVEDLTGFVTALGPIREGLEILRQDIKRLKDVQRVIKEDVKSATPAFRKKIDAIIVPLVKEITEEIEFEDSETQRLIGTADLRSDYRKTIEVYAAEVREYLEAHETKDPNFWTAGTLIVLGGLSLEYIRFKDETIKEDIKETPFEKLSRKKYGTGIYIREYIGRLLK